jgi:ribonuclease BN (tRNA processing enzyme)
LAGVDTAPATSAEPEVSAGTLTVLGCDGGYPGPGGAGSGYLVEVAGVVLWLDAGPGTFANLQRVTDPAGLDAVVLSHEHPDHRSDVDSYAVWLRERPTERPVPVYAPPGLRELSYFGDDPVFAWHELEPSDRVVLVPRNAGSEGVLCSFSATDHGPPTLAVRVDVRGRSGAVDPVRSLAYSADTGPDWSPEELGPGVGLLLCEATYTRDHEGESRHLSGRQAGRMAAAAGISRLVLTHRRPSIAEDALAAEADEAFGRPVHQAATGRVFEW